MPIRSNYEIHYYGDFYLLQDRQCRSTLEIVNRKETNANDLLCRSADVVVVMMNPGSYQPIDRNYGQNREPDEIGKIAQLKLIHPNHVQKAIEDLMRQMNFTHIRVLNLSDIRNTMGFPKEYSKGNLPPGHSIFCDSRHEELKARLGDTSKVVVAWGYHKKLGELARVAYDTMVSLGRQIHGYDPRFGFRYPRPNGRDAQRMQSEWIKGICTALTQ